MEYITEVIDRRSGELATVRLGDWKTVSELAADYDTGPNEFRHVLITMGLLQSEGAQGRRRLTPEAVALGYGKRIEPRRGSKFKYPFDTISPEGQRYIAEHWERCAEEAEAAKASTPDRQRAGDALRGFCRSRSSTMQPQMMVCWLLDHFQCLNHQDIAAIMSCSRQLVDRYATQRSRDIARAKANLIAPVGASSPAV
jgi:hypothetical protein